MRNHFCFLLFVFLSYTVGSTAIDCTPRQIHLALGDAYYYASQYASRFGDLPDANHSATLIFHTQDHCAQVSASVTTTGQTILPVRVTNFTADYPDGSYKSHIYTFYIYNLAPETIYNYQIFANDQSSEVYSFQVPRFSKIGQKNQATKFLFIGDMDMDSISGNTWKRIRSLINSKDFTSYDAFIHLGDLAYNLENDGGLRGDFFMENMSTIASWMPYTIIPGNHENGYNFSNFVNRIRMPLWEKTQNHYYSINVGLVHFTTFDFDFFSANPSLQGQMLDWLEQDLQHANQVRLTWPWVVLINHKPLFCSDLVNYGPECKSFWQTYAAVDNLIYKYKVDLFLTGHVHSYERSLPIHNRQIYAYEKVEGDLNYTYIVNPQAPIHVVEAIAGNVEDHGLRPYALMDFTIYDDLRTGFGQMIAHNATHLQYIHTLSDTNEVFDNFYIIKKSGRPRAPYKIIE